MNHPLTEKAQLSSIRLVVHDIRRVVNDTGGFAAGGAQERCQMKRIDGMKRLTPHST
jgi:hypothetical protein